MFLPFPFPDFKCPFRPCLVNTFKSPFPASPNLFRGLRPSFPRCASPRSAHLILPIFTNRSPMMLHPFVLGTLKPSFSHSHPHCRPHQPSHMRYALYRLWPVSRPSAKPPVGVCGWGGGMKSSRSKEPSRVWRQHGRDKKGTGVFGMRERSGIQGCGRL